MNALLSRRAEALQPPALPGFDHLRRFWEPSHRRWTARLLPGQYYVTRCDEAITTVLGSCVAVCMRDPWLAIGGMNHFMLPEESGTRQNAWLDPGCGLATRYGSYAMESLINQLLKLGAVRERLELKVFGGARILESLADIGLRNIEFVHNYARVEALQLSAQDVGGTQPRRVVYFPASGRVRVRRLNAVTGRIADRDRLYFTSLYEHADGGEVEIFE
jgi:chemotaxis protein CheD